MFSYLVVWYAYFLVSFKKFNLLSFLKILSELHCITNVVYTTIYLMMLNVCENVLYSVHKETIFH